MKTVRILIIWLVIICVPFWHCAQSYGNHIKQAVKNERLGNVYDAIWHYEKYFSAQDMVTKKDAYHALMLAELYDETRDYEKATVWYKKAYEANPRKNVLARYEYARMEKMHANYELASEEFYMFKREFRGKRHYKKYRKKVRIQREGCALAQTMIDSPLNVEVIMLNRTVNCAHQEYSPIFAYDSIMYFASMDYGEEVYMKQGSDDTDLPNARFYKAIRNGKRWEKAGKLEGPFNEKGINTANGVFSPDKSKFYFTRCQLNHQKKMICAIYVSEKKDGTWQEAVKLPTPINLNNYSSTHPAPATESRRNRDVLYFASDRKGGEGGYDIWYVIFRENGEVYKEPRTAGRRVNTVEDEMTPHYDHDARVLYFSSEGLPGMGGFDIFKSSGQLRRWEDPVNVGYPINSSVDDLYYSLNPNDKSEGFLVSNRKTINGELQSCCDDIYYFKYSDYVPLAVHGQVYKVLEDSVKYIEKIFDDREDSLRANWSYLEDALVSLYVVNEDEDILLKTQISGEKGYYFFSLENGKQYKITAEKPGFFSRQLILTTQGRYLADTLERNLKISEIPETPIIIKNIYYPFDEYYLTDSAKTIIDTTIYRLLDENPQIIAEISSHTDNKGSTRYNIKLSTRRANSVVEYLIEKGIDKNRIKAEGYGESQPIAPNTHPDGTDNPEGRQKNRRTEFKVTGTLPDYSKIIYEE